MKLEKKNILKSIERRSPIASYIKTFNELVERNDFHKIKKKKRKRSRKRVKTKMKRMKILQKLA